MSCTLYHPKVTHLMTFACIPTTKDTERHAICSWKQSHDCTRRVEAETRLVYHSGLTGLPGIILEEQRSHFQIQPRCWYSSSFLVGLRMVSKGYVLVCKICWAIDPPSYLFYTFELCFARPEHDRSICLMCWSSRNLS